MRPNLTHIALHVPDAEACIAFYEKHCGLRVVHERPGKHLAQRIVWMAEEGRERQFVLVILPGGPRRDAQDGDYTHLGFAVGSEEAVDQAARRAEDDGCLLWAPRREAYPVGYYCGLVDPAGHVVELSYGQPLGPGAPELT